MPGSNSLAKALEAWASYGTGTSKKLFAPAGVPVFSDFVSMLTADIKARGAYTTTITYPFFASTGLA